jgi:hypothetical protein
LKCGTSFSGITHLLAAARVAAHARRAAVDREAAEAADLDAVAARQRVGHRVEHGLDGELGVALRELREAFGQRVTRSERVMERGTERLAGR